MDCSVFITLGIYTPLEARVYCSPIVQVAHRYGQLYLHCSLICLSSFSCFIVISYSLWGWNNPSHTVSIRLRGEAALSTPEAVVASRARLTNCFWCAARHDDQRQHHHAEHHFQLRRQANSFVYFASSAATSRWRICMSSNCRVRQLQFSGIFVALGFVGNGVITVMINSPWQADDDADNQSGDNRGDSAHTSMSDRSARFFEFCNQAVSLMLRQP